MIILLDENLHEIADVDINVDCEVGTDASNDFEMSNETIEELDARGFYLPNTEIGGLFEYTKMTTDSNIKVFKGHSWRGLLEKCLILPPTGEDYYTVTNKDIHDVMRSLLSNALGGFFEVPADAPVVTVSSFQFPLYCTLGYGLELLCESIGYRLCIYAVKETQGQPIKVYCKAVSASTVEGIFNEDSLIPLVYEEDNMGINHLLCAGQGELQERMKVDLYLDENGEVSETQYFTGFDERTAFYDYSSAESRDDLVDNGTKRLLELANSKKVEIESLNDLELEVGDIVKAVFPDGTTVQNPIVRKIYSLNSGTLTTQVKVKGEA